MTVSAAAGCALLLRSLLLPLLAATLTAPPSICSALRLSHPTTVIFTVSSSGAAVSCTVQLRALLPARSHTAAAALTTWRPVWESGGIAPPAAVIYDIADAHAHCRHQAVLRCSVGADSASAACVYPRHGYFFSPLLQPLSSPLHFHVAAHGGANEGSCLWSGGSGTDADGFCFPHDSDSEDLQPQPVCPVLSNRSRPLPAVDARRSRAIRTARHVKDEAGRQRRRVHGVKLHEAAASTVRWLLLVSLLCLLHALAVLRLMHSCTRRIEAVRAL